MNALETVVAVEKNIDDVQTALSAVQVGLGTVELVAETAEDLRRRIRPVVKLLALLVVAGAAWAIISRRRADAGDV